MSIPGYMETSYFIRIFIEKMDRIFTRMLLILINILMIIYNSIS